MSLRQYAEHLGYRVEGKNRDRSGVLLRLGRQRLVVMMESDGRERYHDPDSPHGQGGDIIDFVQREQRLGFAEICRELRPWISTANIAHSRQEPSVPIIDEHDEINDPEAPPTTMFFSTSNTDHSDT